MSSTFNTRISSTSILPSPDELRSKLPCSAAAETTVSEARRAISAVLEGRDRRPLVIVGPCSVHDVDAALEYAGRLLRVSERLCDALLVVMRVYFEKPRTTVGWKGLINDPHLDGTEDIPAGLALARSLLLDVAELGMPAATEFLDPLAPQYTGDLVSWAAIGARTTESQTHREMASGLSMPVGFKNGTDGGLDVAMNAMLAAAKPHSFLGVDSSGRVAVIRTRGNPTGHLVLRGGSQGPNYHAQCVAEAAARLAVLRLPEKVLVDCSHGNCGKDVARQAEVAQDVAAQLASGSEHVLGIMLESNLHAGRQELVHPARLARGVSITDPCLDFETTERLLEDLAVSVARRSAYAPRSLIEQYAG
ncbi:MAG TPA: 3-deoxy-7-phosphoheptulonate synthase [Polyangiaceae bacterium]|nr:3-deoxy-7-phosphoheptulonate synthase [Polyangiaceae bacterium]